MCVGDVREWWHRCSGQRSNCPLPINFSSTENFLLKIQFGCGNSLFGGNLREKLKFEYAYPLCRTFAVVCWKIANSCPPFFNPDLKLTVLELTGRRVVIVLCLALFNSSLTPSVIVQHMGFFGIFPTTPNSWFALCRSCLHMFRFLYSCSSRCHHLEYPSY